MDPASIGQLRQGSRIVSMSAPGGGRPKEEKEDTSRPDSAHGTSSDILSQDGDKERKNVKKEEGATGGAESDDKEGEEEEEEDNEWGFTKGQMKDLEEAFNVFDINRDGTINPHKLFNVMRSLGLNPTEAEVQDLINAVDEDGNGTIEFDEFCEMMQRKINLPDREDEMKEAFRVFDHDENGVVSIEDMTSLFGALGMDYSQEEIREMVLVGDPTGKMQVDFSNFLRIANSSGPDIPID